MPSHTITMSRTTTTTTSSTALIINTGYLKGVNGILKLVELVIGIICVGISSYYIYDYYTSRYRERHVDIYFLLVAASCLITTFLLLLSALISLASASILPKTVFEYFYHGTAFLLYLTASIAFLVELVKANDNRSKEHGYEAKMAAAVLGLINAGLYLFSAIMAHRVYKIG